MFDYGLPSSDWLCCMHHQTIISIYEYIFYSKIYFIIKLNSLYWFKSSNVKILSICKYEIKLRSRTILTSSKLLSKYEKTSETVECRNIFSIKIKIVLILHFASKINFIFNIIVTDSIQIKILTWFILNQIQVIFKSDY